MANLCGTCEHSRHCEVWGETKCVELKQRIYGSVANCDKYKKRPKNFKEPKCQCEDCQKRETDAEE